MSPSPAPAGRSDRRAPSGARITADGWAYRYPGRARPALRGVSFTVEPGELVVLLGASGSGKSTLLAGLAGVLPEGGDEEGTLTVVRAVEVQGAAAVGLVSQDPQSNVVMETVGDDLAFPLENRAVGSEEIWTRVHRARAEVSLGPDLDASTARLSGGQLQLVAIAGATVADPALLLLDEPTANLDATAAAAVVRAVTAEQARTGCTVVVIEHRVAPWLRRAGLVVVADGGEVTPVAPGELRAHLASRPGQVERVWLDDAVLPERRPTKPPGAEALTARAVAVPGRLAPVDLACRAGEVLALTGPPGSGKSTLLACLAGLLEPAAGTVQLAGDRRDPWRWPAAAVASTFGVVFQDPEHQFLTSTVRAELEHGRPAEDPSIRARVDDLLERLHLADLAAADPFTLSGGEQRRLSVGTALVAGPALLLLDEPTFGQDPTTWRELVSIVAEHRDGGGAVVLATHDPLLVRALGAREVRLTRDRPVGPAGTDSGPDASVDALGAPSDARGLRSLDPLALLFAAGLLSAAALLSASVTLNLSLAAAAVVAALVGGLPPLRVLLLAVPALVATGSVALSNALLGEHGLLSTQSWQAAALPASRVLAVSLPGLVAAVAMDPTGLADSLVVRLRVGPRVAYSVLAGLRMLPLLADEWQVLARASRARGLGGRGPMARARMFTSMTFRLLVSALRRGGRLAVALDARGLTADRNRTVARPVRWRGRDTLTCITALGVLATALATRW